MQRAKSPASGRPPQRARRLRRWVPGLELIQNYPGQSARPDLVAGVVLAAILVPQGMAYAELAGLPAVTGLYTTIACLVGYALFGPSRVLVLGPDSSISPLILASITPLLVVGDPGSAIVLAGMLAIFVGLIEIGLGLGKLGFVADLLSKEVQVGYMNGLGITIIVGQLPKLFGFSTDADSFLSELKAFVEGLGQTHAATLVLGLAVLAILLVLPLFTKRLPAILVGVVAATLASAVFGLADHGVTTIGSLPQGVPTPGLPWTNAGDVPALLLAALGITLVSLTDTIATATSFAARRGEEVKPDQEMIGVGVGERGGRLLSGVRGLDERLEDRGRRAVGGKDPAGRPGRRRARRGPPSVSELAARRPAAGGARGGRDRRGAVADESAAAAPLLRDAQKRARRLPGCHRRGRAARRPAGDRGRGPAGDHPLLSPQLVAARRGPGAPRRLGGLARRDRLPRRQARSPALSSTAGRRRCSSPTREGSATRSGGSRASASLAGSSCSARPSPTST